MSTKDNDEEKLRQFCTTSIWVPRIYRESTKSTTHSMHPSWKNEAEYKAYPSSLDF